MNDDAQDDDFATFKSVSLRLPSFGTAPAPKADDQKGKSAESSGSVGVKRSLDASQNQGTKRSNDVDKSSPFYTDTKGDWDVLSFGKIHQGEVPVYKRSSNEMILGLEVAKDQRFRLENSAKETGAF